MRLLIIGHARSGKDTLAEYWANEFGFTYESSSEAAARIFIYEQLKKKYGYNSLDECIADRVNHRSKWYDLICWYNVDNKSRLAEEIMATSDCYVGMRDSAEIQKCKEIKLFDLIIWIDASKRLPLEPKSSFNIDIGDADIIIDNNDSEDVFLQRAYRLGCIIFANEAQSR